LYWSVNVEAEPRVFTTTRWSLVLAGANSEGEQQNKAAEALAELCRTYWRPAFSYVCRRGYSSEDAEDLTQDFFLMILETNWLRQADQGRGRFRSLLLKSLQNFLHNAADKNRTLPSCFTKPATHAMCARLASNSELLMCWKETFSVPVAKCASTRSWSIRAPTNTCGDRLMIAIWP